MTVALTAPLLSQDSAPKSAEALAIRAPGWRVTAPPPCPTTRAISPGFPSTSAARLARDTRPRRAALDTDADALARRRDAHTAHPRDVPAPACAAALPGTSHRTPAATSPPTVPRGTTAGTLCTAFASSLPSPSRAQRRPPPPRPRPSSPRRPNPEWITIPPQPTPRPVASVDLYPAAGWITRWPALKAVRRATCREARHGHDVGWPPCLVTDALLPDCFCCWRCSFA